MPPPPRLAMEGAAGVAEVHVVERRPRDRGRGDAQAAALERRDDGRDRGGAVVDAGPERAAVHVELRDAGQAAKRRGAVAVPGLDQLDLHGVAAQLALQLLGAALGDDAAAVDDHEPRGEPVGLLEVVRRQQDRHLLLAGQPLDLAPQLGARLGVEARRRLVEEEHRRSVDEAERDVEPALHAAGVRLRRAGARRRPGRSGRAARRRAAGAPRRGCRRARPASRGSRGRSPRGRSRASARRRRSSAGRARRRGRRRALRPAPRRRRRARAW